MSNYDTYLENAREHYENRKSEVEKLWIVVFDKEIYYSDVNRDEAEKVFQQLVNQVSPVELTSICEFGWIWDSEIAADFYKAFNPVIL